MDALNLNLARKWRSKNFDQIIGQDLSVKMLKNSLYLNQFFPVYLFAGQKGCGKTSTARVFSAAINCERLEQFQKDPKNIALPCLNCISCSALMAGRHPDFIEIDAASNTGVDNVRQIIDSSALLPLMGRKKIYLIDEAHMLSKAAFNAFLKLMEEPPPSVIFILATTDTQKVIETVRSRCFQLYFRSVQEPVLLNHLINVCASENIPSDNDALSLIVKETGGSIRDALNLLEQVRFSDSHVSKQAVYQVLGHLDESRLLTLFEIILHKTPKDFLKFAHEESLENFSAEFLWQRMVELLRASIWIKHGITPRNFSEYTSQIQFLTKSKSLQQLSVLLELFYTNESLFRKTTAQYAFFEVILLRICRKNESNSNSNTPALVGASTSTQETEWEAAQEHDDQEDLDDLPPQLEDEQESQESVLWSQLNGKISLLQDPLLESIFKQGKLTLYDQQSNVLHVLFPKELTFFSDIIENTKSQWQVLFEQHLQKKVEIIASFDKANEHIFHTTEGRLAKTSPVKTNVSANVVATPPRKTVYSGMANTNRYSARAVANNELKLDVSSAQIWPKSHLLLHHFPGTITQIREQV